MLEATNRHTSHPGSGTPTCSVVICTRNRPEELERCLEAVARVVYPQVEVLVVDNAPNDERTREVARRRGVRYVVEPAAGLSRARNLGAAVSQGEVVAYIDDDSLPEPSWLGHLAAEFQDPQVMAVTGRICAAETGTIRDLEQSSMSDLDCGAPDRRVFEVRTRSWFERANFGGIGTGGNMAFRRRAFEEGLTFDVRLGRGADLDSNEDHHAFFQLIHRGSRVVYTPHAIVRHPVPSSVKEIHAHHLKSMIVTAAYATLLFVEAPGHRGAIFRFAAQRLTGATSAWCLPGTALAGGTFPVWHRLAACLAGPWLYFRARWGARKAKSASKTCPQRIQDDPSP